MKPATLIRRNPELLAVGMDGETVMMDMQNGNYYGVNTVGTYIWELLVTEQRLDTLLDAVMTHFETREEDTVAKDVRVFLADMQAQKLVEIIPA